MIYGVVLIDPEMVPINEDNPVLIDAESPEELLNFLKKCTFSVGPIQEEEMDIE